MSDLSIHVTTHHLQLSDALRQFVGSKVGRVKRFANDALAADIVLRRHGGAKQRFSASARLSLPGRDVHGRAVDVDLYAAIGQLVTKLARRLRKRKTRLGRKLERVSRYEPSPRASNSESRQELRTPIPDLPRMQRDREGGQEMRVFPFRRRAVLSTYANSRSVAPHTLTR